MGCPVHVWVPLMAAAAPVVRVAKVRLDSLRHRGASDRAPEAAVPLQRWAPIDPHATAPAPLDDR